MLISWSRRPARRSLSRNRLGKLKGIHAVAGKFLVRILEKPQAVMSVFDHAGGNYCPLTCVGSGWLLAVPELCLRNVNLRFRKPVLIHQHTLESRCSTNRSTSG